MRIDDMYICRNPKHPSTWMMHIESGGYRFTVGFDHLLSFMHAVSDAVKFFGQAHGLIEKKADGTYASKVKQ